MWNCKLVIVHFEIINCVTQGMKNGLNPYNSRKKKFTYPFSIKSNAANDQLFASRQPTKCQGKQQKNNLRFLFLILHSTSRFQWDKGTQHTHTGCAGGGGLSYF